MLILAHNAVVRAMFAPSMGEAQNECACIDVPLHDAVKLSAYEAEEQVFSLILEYRYENRTPNSGDRDEQ